MPSSKVPPDPNSQPTINTIKQKIREAGGMRTLLQWMYVLLTMWRYAPFILVRLPSWLMWFLLELWSSVILVRFGGPLQTVEDTPLMRFHSAKSQPGKTLHDNPSFPSPFQCQRMEIPDYYSPPKYSIFFWGMLWGMLWARMWWACSQRGRGWTSRSRGRKRWSSLVSGQLCSFNRQLLGHYLEQVQLLSSTSANGPSSPVRFRPCWRLQRKSSKSLLDLDGGFFMARAEVTIFARFGKCTAEEDCTCQIPRYESEGSRWWGYENWSWQS